MAFFNYKLEDCSIVYFDLATTGTTIYSRIIQVGAVYKDSQFNTYIHPDMVIPEEVTQYNGFETRGELLYFCDQEKQTYPRNEALLQFTHFLRKNKPVLLVAHNAFNFHAKILVKQIKQCDLFNYFASVVYGFIDTLPIFKTCEPNRQNIGKNYKLPDLALDFLGSCYTKRNALHDSKMLRKLIDKEQIADAFMHDFVRSVYELV